MKKLFQNNNKHLIGGSIGVIVCVLLFILYIFAYFPLIEKLHDQGRDVSASEMLPFITGHAFPLFAHFIIEGSPAIGVFCPNVEKICTSWSAGTMPGYEPWVMENTTGYCTDSSMVPLTSCTDKVEVAGFFILCLMLIIAYFFLGIFITWLILKIKVRLKE